MLSILDASLLMVEDLLTPLGLGDHPLTSDERHFGRRGLVQRFAPIDCCQDVGDNVLLGSIVPTSTLFPGRYVVCCGCMF